MNSNDGMEYLLNYVRRNLREYENDMPSLFQLVQEENEKLSHPFENKQLYKIMQEALKKGAIISSPPLICEAASDIDIDNACEPQFFIPQILAEGVSLLNAPPKKGKSRMLMQMAIALCRGETFMGRQCSRVSCLYLALEDERIDFENRLRLFMDGEEAPNNLFFATKEDFDYGIPTLENDELIELVEANLKMHSSIRVVMIDVFGAIRSNRQKGEDFMNHERRDVESLIRMAARNHIALVVAHHVSHSKKRGLVETIGSGAGSYVLAACVHAEMLLYQQTSRTEDDCYTFSVQGRRMPLQKFTIEDRFPRWRFCGGADEYEAANNPLIVTIKHAVDHNENKRWCGSASELLEYGIEHKLPAIPNKINRNTFTPKVVRQLAIVGISYQQVRNGKGAVKHQFREI